MNIKSTVSLKVGKLLQSRNMTQYSLAKKAGVPYNTVKSLMSNKGLSTSINLKTIIQIAYGFDMHISEFLKGTEFDYKNLDID